MVNPPIPTPVLAWLHPAVAVNVLFSLQGVVWAMWAVAILGGGRTARDGRDAAWRFFAAGALVKAAGVAVLSLLSDAFPEGREALRDWGYPAFSLLALGCWSEHGARELVTPGRARRRWRVVAALWMGLGAALLAWRGWAAWPWVGGLPWLVLGLVLAWRARGAGMRAAYVCWALPALAEWAGPRWLFSWFVSFTPDLAYGWEDYAAAMAGVDTAFLTNGRLYLHVPGITRVMAAGLVLATAAGFGFWAWAARAREGRRGRVLWLAPVLSGGLLLAGFTLYNFGMVTMAGVMRRAVGARLEAMAAVAAELPEGARVRALLARQADLGRHAIVELRDGRLVGRPGLAEAVPEAEGRPLPEGLGAAVARGESAFWGPLRAGGGELVFYGFTPIGEPIGETGPARWLLTAQPYHHGAVYRRPMALAAGVASALGGLLGALGLAYWLRRERELAERAARERAEATERAQSELLAALGHDVRTPLQSVLAYAELLEATALDPGQRELLTGLREQTRGLGHLLQNLLQLGAVRMGLPPRREVIEPAALVAELRGTFAPMATAKGLRYADAVADEVPRRVEGDGTRLRQILLNLLRNAVTYTARGEVALEVRGVPAEAMDEERAAGGAGLEKAGGDAARGWLEFVVRDTGPGLPAEARRRLVTMRPVGVGTRLAPDSGFGLGLPLVGRLCLWLGGGVTAEAGPAGGTELRVRLPFFPAKQASGPIPSARSGGGPARVPRRVLLVEDHATLRELLRAGLARHGLRVEVAGGVAEAERLWRGATEPFDAALVDLGLPDGDGLELAARLRSWGRGPVWLAALTAAAGGEAASRALAAGFDVYLPKPIEPSELARLLGAGGVGAEAPTAAGGRSAGAGDWNLRLARIDAASRVRDAGLVAREAHYLRTSALLARAEDDAARLAAMEKAALAADWAAVEALRRELRENL